MTKVKRCDILNEFDANDTKTKHIDAWLSLVERCVRDAEVAGSNPVASINWQKHRRSFYKICDVFYFTQKIKSVYCNKKNAYVVMQAGKMMRLNP